MVKTHHVLALWVSIAFAGDSTSYHTNWIGSYNRISSGMNYHTTALDESQHVDAVSALQMMLHAVEPLRYQLQSMLAVGCWLLLIAHNLELTSILIALIDIRPVVYKMCVALQICCSFQLNTAMSTSQASLLSSLPFLQVTTYLSGELVC